jgi:hypothetical protein
MEPLGARFGVSTNRLQYPSLHQQPRSFGRMGFPMPSGQVTSGRPMPGGSQAAGMIKQNLARPPRSAGAVGDTPVFRPRPPLGGVTGTLPGRRLGQQATMPGRRLGQQPTMPGNRLGQTGQMPSRQGNWGALQPVKGSNWGPSPQRSNWGPLMSPRRSAWGPRQEGTR